MLALILLLTVGASSPSATFAPRTAWPAQADTGQPQGIHGSSIQAKILTATPEARELIQQTATAANLLGVDKWGNSVYARIIDNGSQVWALVRNGFIRDAGVNLTPEPLNRLLKQ